MQYIICTYALFIPPANSVTGDKVSTKGNGCRLSPVCCSDSRQVLLCGACQTLAAKLCNRQVVCNWNLMRGKIRPENYRLSDMSSPICHGGDFLVLLEEFAERCLVRKMKQLRNLCYRSTVILKHGHGLVYQFIADDLCGVLPVISLTTRVRCLLEMHKAFA